jgi:hypothetical protein
MECRSASVAEAGVVEFTQRLVLADLDQHLLELFGVEAVAFQDLLGGIRVGLDFQRNRSSLVSWD